MITWRWLKSTKELQETVYGYSQADFDAATLSEYIDWNQTAAVQELAELREEFSWKPWADDPPFVNRERAIAEIVDCLHFIGNMLVSMGVDDDELEGAYRKKQQINRERAAGNYSAKKGGLGKGSD